MPPTASKGYGDKTGGGVADGPVGEGCGVNVGLTEGVKVMLAVSVGAGVSVMVDEGRGTGVSVNVGVGVSVLVEVGVKLGGSVGTTEVGVNVGKASGVGKPAEVSAFGSTGAGRERLMTT